MERLGPREPLSPDEIADSLQVVADVLQQVGPYICERAGAEELAGTHADDGSPVTRADHEVEAVIKREVARRSPRTLVTGEETGYGPNLPNAIWLADPIDGTAAFMEGIPSFTSMAVLIQSQPGEKPEAVAAVIHNPSTGDTFTGQKGRGTYKNGVRITLGDLPLPGVAHCKTEFIPELSAMLAPAGVVCKPAPTGGGFGFTQVLDNLSAARFTLHGGGHIHDYAPGGLLVREAGGVLIPILNDTYTYDTKCFVACHPDLEATLLPHVPRLREIEHTRTTRPK